MKKILRYPEDRWPLAYTLMILAVQLGLFFAVENLWMTALCVLLFQPVQAWPSPATTTSTTSTFSRCAG